MKRAVRYRWLAPAVTMAWLFIAPHALAKERSDKTPVIIVDCTAAPLSDADPNEDLSHVLLTKGANAYADQCLSLHRFSDRNADTAILTLSAVANSDAQQISVIPQYVRRSFDKYYNGSRYNRSAYWRVRAGIQVATSSDDRSAELFDLDRGRLAEGVGGVFGLERGWTSRPFAKLRTDLVKAIGTARQDCVTANVAAMAERPDRPADLFAAAAQYCAVPANFATWVEDADRGNRYFKSILAPLWGYGDQPKWWVGTELALAKPRFDYVPIGNPALSPSLDSPLTRREWVYHAQGYVGKTLRSWFAEDDKGAFTRRTFTVAVVGTVAYRREAGFAPGTRDQQVCPAAATGFALCKKVNIAAPYINEGVTLAARVNVDIARAWVFPQVGLGLKVAHATDTGQWAGEIPLHLFADDEQRLSGGIRIGASGDGRTRSGVELPGEQRVTLFVGSTFQLSQR